MLCRRRYFFIHQILEWCRHPLQCTGMDSGAGNRPQSHFVFKALQHDLFSYFLLELSKRRSIFIQPSPTFSENEHDLIPNCLQHADIQLYLETCICALKDFLFFCAFYFFLSTQLIFLSLNTMPFSSFLAIDACLWLPLIYFPLLSCCSQGQNCHKQMSRNNDFEL